MTKWLYINASRIINCDHIMEIYCDDNGEYPYVVYRIKCFDINRKEDILISGDTTDIVSQVVKIANFLGSNETVLRLSNLTATDTERSERKSWEARQRKNKK